MALPIKRYAEYPDGTSGTGVVGGDKIIAERVSGDQNYVAYTVGELGVTRGVSFTEDGSGTSYTATVEIPAGSFIRDIGFVTTVLWDGTSAGLVIGDDDDPNGWFETINLKATDLLVGEQLSISNAENWAGKNGAYLVAATGRKGRVTAGVDSGTYQGAATEVIFLVTPGAADGSAGRSFGWVTYSTPTFTASTNV